MHAAPHRACLYLLRLWAPWGSDHHRLSPRYRRCERDNCSLVAGFSRCRVLVLVPEVPTGVAVDDSEHCARWRALEQRRYHAMEASKAGGGTGINLRSDRSPGVHEVWVRHPNNRDGPLAAGRARTGSIGRNNGDSEGTSGAKAEAAAPASAAVGVLPQGPERRTRQVRSPKRSAMAKSRPRLACARFCSALGPGDRGLWV